MKVKFPDLQPFILPDPAIPVLIRLNKVSPDDEHFEPLYWSDYDSGKRFSLPGCKQTYLSTSFDALSEAAPWRSILEGGSSFPLVEKDFDGYYVSYIRPKYPISLLNITDNEESYGVTSGKLLGDDLSYPQAFAQQVRDHKPEISGILYNSKFRQAGKNIVLFDVCRAHFDESSCIHSEKLIDAIRPMKALIQKRIGVKFLFHGD